MSLRKLKEVTMTANGHVEVSKESHGEVKEYIMEIGINREKKHMSQVELEKETVEIREGLSTMMELLQRSGEDWCSGWTLGKRNVQWHALKQKQRKRLIAWLKNEQLGKAQLSQRLRPSNEVHIFKLEQGIYLETRIVMRIS